MNFKDYLKTSAVEIDQEVGKFLKAWKKETVAVSPRLSHLSQTLLDSCDGGKKIRGTLVKLGYEMVGRKFETRILKPAAAFEVFHPAILAHDDIIDQSLLRRGKPTLYQVLGGNHYGISQTICLGDIGFFLAMKLITDSNFPDKEKNQALQSFIHTVIDTGVGEMLDVELPYVGGLDDEDSIMSVFHLKTARYTIVGPLQLGAILGRASQKLLDQLAQFGEDLGIAFQIQDDLLGVFGDEETLGKSVTSDIEEGKATLLINYAQKHANSEQKAVLSKYYGQGKIGEKELEMIKKIFIETGAVDYSKKKAVALVSQAKKVIGKMNISEKHKDLLFQMADFLIVRDK